MQKKLLLIAMLCMTSMLFSHETDKASHETDKASHETDKASDETDKASDEEEKIEPLPIGNFSLPSVTQIAPLISFGQLLIGAKALLPEVGGACAWGHDSYSDDIIPNVIYGIRDDLSITFFAPFSPGSRAGSSYSAGAEDFWLQLEYAFYSSSYIDHTQQATIVTNLQLPTGSLVKNPPTGTGTAGGFIGATYAYLSWYHYAFISSGVAFTARRQDIKFGDTYFYQWGLAQYIKQLSPPGWVLNVMVEFDGAYTKEDRIQGVLDPDSGGNLIVVTPSLYLSSERWIFQWGVSFPMLQDLNGNQDRFRYAIDYNIGLAFQF